MYVATYMLRLVHTSQGSEQSETFRQLSATFISKWYKKALKPFNYMMVTGDVMTVDDVKYE